MNKKFDPFVAEWISFAKSPNFNLSEKCLKLSQLLEYPDLNINEYVVKLNEIRTSLKISIDATKDPKYLISMLNQHLFENYGFRGDEDDYYNPKNNFLNDVIDKKSGIPLTLSIIYCEVAKHIGLDLRVVGFPSHIIVKYNEDLFLDPFNKGRLLSVDSLQEILDRNFAGQVEFSPNFLNEITHEQILARMLRNLKNSYTQSYAYEMAMRCTNMILALDPDSPEEVRDKGILEDRLLDYHSALKHLNRYLELNPNAEDVDFILELIRNIRSKVNL